LIRPFNQRIAFDMEGEGELGLMENEFGGDGDELSRDKLKRSSNQIILAMEKKKKRKGIH